MSRGVYRRLWWIRVLVLVLMAGFLTGCGFPRDPRGTLDKVLDGGMRVGVATNEPWTRIEDGRASGVEIKLLKEFAGELETEAIFVPGTVPELLEATRQGEVDVVVGGFTDASPGVREKKEAGVTSPYLTTRLVVGVPPGAAGFEDPSGKRVGISRTDHAAAALLKENGAVPVPLEDPSTTDMPIAAYEWQLEQWGFQTTGVELPEEKHVMAVPPGENGFLVRLETFLRAHRLDAERLLREETLR